MNADLEALFPAEHLGLVKEYLVHLEWMSKSESLSDLYRTEQDWIRYNCHRLHEKAEEWKRLTSLAANPSATGDRRAEAARWLREAAEFRKRANDRLDEIPTEFHKVTEFESVRPQQFKAAVTYFGKSNPKIGLILFSEESGTGKTSAAYGLILQEIHGGNPNWEFIRSSTLIRLAKGKHIDAKSKRDFEAIFNRSLETRLLILDDLGTENWSQASEEILFELIDTRCAEHLRTVITTNYQPLKLADAFSDKNSRKIIRRLKQFFQTIDFSNP